MSAPRPPDGPWARLTRLAQLARLRLSRPTRRRPATSSPHRPDHPSLLAQVVSGSLEPDYEVVARRRAAEQAARPGDRGEAGRADGVGGRRRALRRRWGTAAVLAAFVVLVVAAGLENRADEPADALVRETLVQTVTERRDALADLQGEVADARQGNAELAAEASRVARERADAVTRLRRVGAASGFQAVSGDGLLMTLTDAPQQQGGELIRSDDLALLVDGLWAAGAEAIAVNGERLSARSAITTTNVSININRRPLTAPYAVRALGDSRVLEAELAETQGGGAWLLLVQEYGFGYEVEAREGLDLPAAPELLLRTCDACFPNLDEEPSGQEQGR